MLQFWWHQEGPSNEQFLHLLIWSLGSLSHNDTKRARESRFQFVFYIFLTSLLEVGIACMYLRPFFWMGDLLITCSERSFDINMTNTWDKHLKVERIHFFSPEISVHSLWFQGFRPMGRQCDHVTSCLLHGRQEQKKRKQLSARDKQSKPCPVTYFSPVRLYLNFPESPQIMLFGTKHLTHKPVGDISYSSHDRDPHCAKCKKLKMCKIQFFTLGSSKINWAVKSTKMKNFPPKEHYSRGHRRY